MTSAQQSPLAFDFSGQVAVVTGGSRGIGRGIATAFAQAGAKVALTFQSNEQAAQKTLSELPGSGHKMYQFDVSHPESVETTLTRIHDEMGGLHVLVNNAGIARDQLLLRMKPDDWDAVLATNLRSVFLCTKTAVKLMMKSRKAAAPTVDATPSAAVAGAQDPKGHSIVNITSVIGQTGNPGQASYAASKAGIIAFTKSVAQEVASRQIRLNCIAPGFIQSDMTDSLSEEQRKGILEKVPLGRMGDSFDVAYGCLFLASNFARYITGHTLDVNGGLHMN